MMLRASRLVALFGVLQEPCQQSARGLHLFKTLVQRKMLKMESTPPPDFSTSVPQPAPSTPADEISSDETTANLYPKEMLSKEESSSSCASCYSSKYYDTYPDRSRMVWCVVYVEEFEDNNGITHKGTYLRWPKYKKTSCEDSLIYEKKQLADGKIMEKNWNQMTKDQIEDYRAAKALPLRGICLALLLGLLVGALVGYWLLVLRRSSGGASGVQARRRQPSPRGADQPRRERRADKQAPASAAQPESADRRSRERPQRRTAEEQPESVVVLDATAEPPTSGHITPGGKPLQLPSSTGAGNTLTSTAYSNLYSQQYQEISESESMYSSERAN